MPSSSSSMLPPSTSTMDSISYTANARNPSQAQPSPEMTQSTSSGFDDVDYTNRGGVFQQTNPGHPPTGSSSTTSTGPSAGPHLNQKPAPTYRYASKSQIANTYMGRLGSAVMDKYQRNLNQIYKNLDTSGGQSYSSASAGTGQGAEMQAGEARTSFSQSSSGGPDPSDSATGDQAEHHPQFGVVSSPGYPDIASDKGGSRLTYFYAPIDVFFFHVCLILAFFFFYIYACFCLQLCSRYSL